MKMVLESKELSAFTTYLEDIKTLKESFNHSKIIYIQQTHNTHTYNFARSVMN